MSAAGNRDRRTAPGRRWLVLFTGLFAVGCAPYAVYEPMNGPVETFSVDEDSLRTPEDACSLDWYERSDPITRPHERMGELSAQEGGFEGHCDEAKMRAILADRACSLGAQGIVILLRNGANFVEGTCFRMKGGLIRYTDGDS
jgi:hypothetical protein